MALVDACWVHARLQTARRDGPSAAPTAAGRVDRGRPGHRVHAGRTHRSGGRQHQPPHEGAGRGRAGGRGPRTGQRPPRAVVAQEPGGDPVVAERRRGRRGDDGRRRRGAVAEPGPPARDAPGLGVRPRGLRQGVGGGGVLVRLLAAPLPGRAVRVLRGAGRGDGPLEPSRDPGRRTAARVRVRVRPRRPGQAVNRDFRRLWLGETTSAFGSSITSVAFPLIAAVTLRADTFVVGLIAAVAWVPWLVIGLPAGAWVDRLSRRTVMLTCDIASALLYLSIPAAQFLGILTVAQLVVVALLTGVAAVFFTPAYRSYL